MLIRIDDIKEQGITIELSEGVEKFPVLQRMEEAGEVGFASPVHAKVRAIKVRDVVEVEGDADTVLRLACARCLSEFEMPLAISFALTFARELPQVVEEDGEEVELSAEEMGLIPFEGEEIDLRPALEEQIVMALPVQPLCQNECKGLCPQCGMDLNASGCECIRPVFNQKFGSLKNFVVDGNGTGNKK